jgi:hypothetical protein
MCFHKPTATLELVESMRAEVQELVLMLKCTFEDIQENSKIAPFDIESESSKRDVLSIHFQPENSTERQGFSRLLTDELILRGLDVSGTLEERRKILCESMESESTISRLSKEISHGEVKEGAYFYLMQTLPCVLHMENRNGIKLLGMALIEGLSNTKKKLLYLDVSAEGTRVSRFITDIQNLINTSIIGTNADPCQWVCPFDSRTKEIGPITMDNMRTWHIIDSFDLIIEFCVVDQECKSLWMRAVNNYCTLMVLL